MKLNLFKDKHPALVVKHNDLIQKSKFSLSLQQQKILLYIISKIKPTDTEFQEYTFTVKEFCRVCGIEDREYKSIYEKVRQAIKDIADKSVWLNIDGTDSLLRWIEKARIKDGVITIRLDDDMKPYLLGLKNNYTMYELVWALNFKSKYSLRLYELVKSIHYNESNVYKRVYTVEELKQLIGGESYANFTDFKRRVLEPAINEISETSDKIIEYEIKEKRGKTIYSIELKIYTLDNPVKVWGKTSKLKGNTDLK